LTLPTSWFDNTTLPSVSLRSVVDNRENAAKRR
jgi:hypothetical protein